MIIVTTWGFIKTYLCHEFYGKDEWVMLQLEDWNSKPMSCGHWLNHTGSLKELFLRHHPEFSRLKFFVSKTWNRSICIHIVPLQSNSSPKRILKKFTCETYCFFLVNHGVNRRGDANWDWDDCFLIDESNFYVSRSY